MTVPNDPAIPDGEPLAAALAAVQLHGCEATQHAGLTPYNAVRYVPIALDAIPDGWARIEQQWVKLPDIVYASLVDDEHPGDDEWED